MLSVRVFDLLGHSLGTYRESSSLDLSYLYPGTYLLILNDGRKQFVRKLNLAR